jgi:hypothetical protein
MGSSLYSLRGSLKTEDRQPQSTDLNQGQRDFGGVCEVREPVFIDWRLIRMCHDEMDAINLCIDLSRLKDEYICSALSIDKGHWSRIRKGTAHFPTAKRLELMRLCGNWAPIQYELDVTGLMDKLEDEFRREHVQHPAASTGYQRRTA